MPLVQTNNKSPIAGDQGRWPKLPLNPLHTSAWSETKATMIWAVPSYADIWLSMMCDKDHEMAWFTDQLGTDKHEGTAATDDKFLYINPVWFFKLTLDERLFVGCHEIAHAMYGHAGLFWMLHKQGHIDYNDGVRLPLDHELLNEAADYVINDQLVTAKIGALPEDGLHWPALITGDMSVLDAYRLLYEFTPPGPMRGTSSGGTGTGHITNHTTNPAPGKSSYGSSKSFDQVLKPGQGQGKSPNKAMSERSQVEWDTAITAAMESAKLRGQLPRNLERLFTKRLSPQADWRDLYMLAVSKKIGNDRYTWERMDPQLAYRNVGLPGRTSFGCDLVVIVVDTSGSINQKTFEVFIAESTGLLEQAKPKRLIFVQCDTDIQEWSELDGVADLYECKLKQGGGTSFRAPFERVEAEGLEPDLLVYLTDLYGDQNEIKAPSYPVIWGCITKENAPWGEIVRVPEQHSGE